MAAPGVSAMRLPKAGFSMKAGEHLGWQAGSPRSNTGRTTLAQGGTMAFDALSALKDAGNPIDMLSEAQRKVLAGLSTEEVATWNSIKGRLDAVGGEVEGQHVFIII
jgi:hypothetical protein